MKICAFFILIWSILLLVSDVSAYQVANTSWSTVTRADGTYRIGNFCGRTIFFPDNVTNVDFYRATTSNVRIGCVRVHKVVPIAGGATWCPAGSVVLNTNDWINRVGGSVFYYVWSTNMLALVSGQYYTVNSDGELRCDFL